MSMPSRGSLCSVEPLCVAAPAFSTDPVAPQSSLMLVSAQAAAGACLPGWPWPANAALVYIALQVGRHIKIISAEAG